MFAYFGYGSNINLISLRAKGVEPISSEHAILQGWDLKFNVKHWFDHEGGVGNIVPSNDENSCVEGIVHLCDDEHLEYLDLMESYGLGYDRIDVELKTKNGLIKAITYIGLPAFIDNDRLPTKRYLNIILNGAKSAGLNEEYIKKLVNHPTVKLPYYTKFEHPNIKTASFNKDSLIHQPHLTALAGTVFDISNVRFELKGLQELFGGKDMTLFHLKRHDTSNGKETILDFVKEQITEGQAEYINAYLHEYLKEFKYVGTYSYT
jgi:gamma-glutamylcyclotransferase (GGCT)/AIG2-like uncharacterized protein YtfP